MSVLLYLQSNHYSISPYALNRIGTELLGQLYCDDSELDSG